MAKQSFLTGNFQGQTVEELRREMQFRFQRLVNHVDQLAGKRGTPEFAADVDLKTNRLMNVGTPRADTDAEQRGLSLHRPDMAGTWDAQNTSIQNLPRGELLTDAVNLEQVRGLLIASLQGSFPIGMIVLWSGSIVSIPSGWALCDGTGSTPDLRDRFVVGAGTTFNPGDTGGSDSVSLAHTHDVGSLVNSAESAHTHASGSLSTDTDATTPSATTTVDQDLAGATVAVASATHTHSHSHSVTGGSTGGGSSHTHTLSGASASALTTADNKPLYYSLAFIMKVA